MENNATKTGPGGNWLISSGLWKPDKAARKLKQKLSSALAERWCSGAAEAEQAVWRYCNNSVAFLAAWSSKQLNGSNCDAYEDQGQRCHRAKRNYDKSSHRAHEQEKRAIGWGWFGLEKPSDVAVCCSCFCHCGFSWYCGSGAMIIKQQRWAQNPAHHRCTSSFFRSECVYFGFFWAPILTVIGTLRMLVNWAFIDTQKRENWKILHHQRFWTCCCLLPQLVAVAVLAVELSPF